MFKLMFPLFLAVALLPGFGFALTAKDLIAQAPSLKPEVAQRAIDALGCAADATDTIDKLIVVDMAMASRAKRLWAFDLSDPLVPRMVLNSRVAHGSGSDRRGMGVPSVFSDTPDSHMTSLGLYKVAESYRGKHGLSRRLDGLFRGFNSNARDRAVVMHPSNYVSEHRVGRSQGCPAVSHEAMQALEQAGLSNAVLWIDAPDQRLAEVVEDCARKRRERVALQQAISVSVARVEQSWRSVLAIDFGSVQTFALPSFAATSVLVEPLPETSMPSFAMGEPLHELRQVDRLLAAIVDRSDAHAGVFESSFLMNPAIALYHDQVWSISQAVRWSVAGVRI